ncbi:MAG: hypothetical protein GXP63_05995 [DPANN group archaeon]|nr:hypothetical protein [DPANN group archaeon]
MNVKEAVWKEIRHSQSIRIDLARGFINTRALAMYLKRRLLLNASLDAIISAIRRYQEEDPFIRAHEAASKVVIGAKLTSNNHIASIMLRKNDEVERLLPRLSDEGLDIHSDRVRIVRAQKSLKIYLDDKYIEQVKGLFSEKDIIGTDTGLGEVIVDLREHHWETPGVLNVLSSEIALHNISIHEMVTCIPEIIFYFSEQDLMKAYEVLYNLSRAKKDQKSGRQTKRRDRTAAQPQK